MRQRLKLVTNIPDNEAPGAGPLYKGTPYEIDCHQVALLPDGTEVFVDETIGLEWCTLWKRQTIEDYGDNVYGSRTPSTEFDGLAPEGRHIRNNTYADFAGYLQVES